MKHSNLSGWIARDLNSWNYLYLMAALLLLLIADPIISMLPGAMLFGSVLNTMVILAGIWGVRHRKRGIWIVLLSGIPSIIIAWLGQAGLFPDRLGILLPLYFVTYVTLSVLILSHLFYAEEIGPNVIFGALSVYLMIGVIFAAMYAFVELHMPGSYHGIDANLSQVSKGTMGFVYYSFVTLTTLGYGDIYPLSPVARSLAILEAMIGVMYTAVLVARLVSLLRIERQRAA
jgi:hypothetical protein